MAKTYITWLADVLRGAGCSVREEGDWRNRDSPGDFQPIGVLWHHTAGGTASSSNPAPSLSIVINGRSDLPGPLCHALIDYNGVFRLVSAGNANHAGTSRGSGPIPSGDGNVTLIGWEIDYAAQDGQRMSDAQYSAAIKGTAAVIKRLGKDASYVRGHKETSTTGKIDPQYVEMDQVRADVATQLRGGSPSNLFFIKTKSTSNARVEVHSASGTSGYQSSLAGGASSRFNTYETNYGVFVIDNADLYFIKTSNTGGDKIQVHSASASSGYQNSVAGGTNTRFNTYEASYGTFTIDNGNLYYIKTANTGNSGKVQVHSASAGSGYQNSVAGGADTWFNTSSAANGTFTIDNGNLYYIKTANTGDGGKIQVYSASASSSYQTGVAGGANTRFGLNEVAAGVFTTD